jgi:hypothetical protein
MRQHHATRGQQQSYFKTFETEEGEEEAKNVA